MNIIHRPEWAIPEGETTPETVFFNRRKFMTGAAGAVAAGALGGIGALDWAEGAEAPKDKTLSLYPAKRNPEFKLDRPLTEEQVAATYNNFYEFGGTKGIFWLSKRLSSNTQ